MNLILNLFVFLFLIFIHIDAQLLDKCRLPNQYPNADVAIGFPRIKNRVKTLGVLNITLLFVDFSDVPAVRSPKDVFSIISPTAENFFSKCSYGKLKVNLIPNLKWLRMSKKSIYYGMQSTISFAALKAYINEAASLASSKWNFSTSQEIVVITNPDANAIPYGPTFTPAPGNGITVNGNIFENGAMSGKDLLYWKGFWFNHEVSHSMGLPDLYGFSGDKSFRFTGSWSIMGNINALGREYFGWERWLLGWLDDSQVLCGTAKSFRTTLTAIEIPGGLKLVVLPTGKTSAVVIESRKKLGYDSAISNPGILTYIVDSSIRSGNGTIRVLPINDNDELKMNATIAVGKSFIYNNINIRYESSTNTTDTIYVSKS